jgi:hypothetical protein
MTKMLIDRALLEQALEALGFSCPAPHLMSKHDAADTALRAALAQEEQEPWTDRELELIDGMIEVQLRHAAQCDVIANRPMAEKQKGWDMERVALLMKIRNAPPRREWKGLTEEEIWELYYDERIPEGERSDRVDFARAIEQALKERNHG